MRKYCDKCRCHENLGHSNSDEYPKTSSCYKESNNRFKNKISGRNSKNVSKGDLIKIGESLVKSGYELENALTKLLDAEARKINAIIKKYEDNNCKINLETKEDILILNEQLKSSLCSIKEIEEIMKLKIMIGLYLLDEELACYNKISENHNLKCSENSNEECKTKQLENCVKETVDKECHNENDCEFDESDLTEGLDEVSYGFQYLLDMLNDTEE